MSIAKSDRPHYTTYKESAIECLSPLTLNSIVSSATLCCICTSTRLALCLCRSSYSRRRGDRSWGSAGYRQLLVSRRISYHSPNIPEYECGHTYIHVVIFRLAGKLHIVANRVGSDRCAGLKGDRRVAGRSGC